MRCLPYRIRSCAAPPSRVSPARRTQGALRLIFTARLVAVAAILVLAAIPAEADEAGLAAANQIPIGTSICEVQAGGGSSPLVDTLVVVEGVVTVDFIETDLLGFFMQAPGCDVDPGDGDDPDSSDGILVFTNRETEISVSPGELVRVTGIVNEYFGMTEIEVCPPYSSDLSVAACSVEVIGEASVPEPILLEVPAEAAAATPYLEAHEGMLVALPTSRVIGATNTHGEAYVVPASSGVMRIFRSDDEGRSLGLMFPLGWQVLDHADQVEGLVGALNYAFGNFKLVIDGGAEFDVTRAGIEPPRAAPAGPDEVTIATYNVENFFDPVDDPHKNDTEWTPSEADYAISVARRALSIRDFLGKPDIIGLQEVESIRALTDLAEHEHLADAGYEALLVEGPDGRGIDVGFLYRRGKIELVSHAAHQKCVSPEPIGGGPLGRCALPDGGDGFPLFGRPPLVATFKVRDTGGRLNVIVNHFKSKSGEVESKPSVRTDMAKHVVELVAELEDSEPAVPVIVLGDLNDFEDSLPLETFWDAGFSDLRTRVPAEMDYTYVFNGVSQNLDYILVRPPMEESVIAFGPLHINADYGAPPDGKSDHPSPRVSDHDPVLLRLSLPRRHSIWLPQVLKVATRATAPGFGPTVEATVGPTLGPTSESTSVPTGEPTSVQTSESTAAPTGESTSVPTYEPTTVPTAVTCPSAPRSPLQITELNFDGEVSRMEPDEYLEFKNVTADPILLADWKIVSVRGDQFYLFAIDAEIGPDERCRVYTDLNDDVAPAIPCSFDWNHSSGGIWNNSGDKAEIRSPEGLIVDQRWYGDCNCAGECGDVP